MARIIILSQPTELFSFVERALTQEGYFVYLALGTPRHRLADGSAQRIGATHSPPRFGGYNIGYK
jgi:hypothetical protein